MLNVTEIRIKKIDNGNFLGYASIMVEDCFIIDGIELYNGKDGRYILMPLNPKQKRQRKNCAYPITDKARIHILNLISEEYDKLD